MKRTLLFGIGMLLLPLLVRSQSGLVSGGGDDPSTQSSVTVGQIFTLGIAAGGYLGEGLQQPFLYRGADTLLDENRNYPVTYRPAVRNPQNVDYVVEHPGHVADSLYLLPTQGLDSLMDVMCYGVTYVNDTTVVAPYSVCSLDFNLQQPVVLPAGKYTGVRFENLKGETGYWSTQRDSDALSNQLTLQYYCSEPLTSSVLNATGLSVRCLKQ